jgi:hypothetical protein
MQLVPQTLPLQTNPPQGFVDGGWQAPPAQSVSVSVPVPFEQLGLAHGVPSLASQAWVPVVPLLVPRLHVATLAVQSAFGLLPAVAGTQVLPVGSTTEQATGQASEAQTNAPPWFWVQNPLVHWKACVQAVPLLSLGTHELMVAQ